ncbi:MAG: hypothetical protein AB7U25_14320 [Vicinamibacterales bacterium]
MLKAMMNAVELASALREPDSIGELLRRSSKEQAAGGNRVTELGVQMERAFVWEAPDFSTMTEPAARAWWTTSIRFPEGFSHIAPWQRAGRLFDLTRRTDRLSNSRTSTMIGVSTRAAAALWARRNSLVV